MLRCGECLFLAQNRQFAAMQHHARYARKTGLSSDMAGTAVPDPNLTHPAGN
jgi:hypothetical protein